MMMVLMLLNLPPNQALSIQNLSHKLLYQGHTSPSQKKWPNCRKHRKNGKAKCDPKLSTTHPLLTNKSLGGTIEKRCVTHARTSWVFITQRSLKRICTTKLLTKLVLKRRTMIPVMRVWVPASTDIRSNRPRELKIWLDTKAYPTRKNTMRTFPPLAHL